MSADSEELRESIQGLQSSRSRYWCEEQKNGK